MVLPNVADIGAFREIINPLVAMKTQSDMYPIAPSSEILLRLEPVAGGSRFIAEMAISRSLADRELS
jgi:hypothetical protein